MNHLHDGSERRKHLRHSKSYSLFYWLQDSPDKRSDGTLIKDISKGGVRFTTSQPLEVGAQLIIEIAVPYIAPKRITLGGLVVSSKEISPRLVYEIRVQFKTIDDQTLQLFDLIGRKKQKGS